MNRKRIYIYGAHSRAQTLAGYFHYLYPDLIVEAYLYGNEEKNPEKIGGIEVIHLTDGTLLRTSYPVYIGTKGIYHQQITKQLQLFGFEEIYPVNVEMDSRLRNEYMKKYFANIGRKFVKIGERNSSMKVFSVLPGGEDISINEKEMIGSKSLTVYVAHSIFDKVLNQDYTLAFYEKEIYTGAIFSKTPFSPSVITDCKGDNISDRNRQFCELTALYWIWKHTKEDIIGLVHYRRHFILPEDWILQMKENDVDVILPVPLYVASGIAENYKSRHVASDWDYMMDCLKKRDPIEEREAKIFFRTNVYSPCNMFIMRRKILDALCEWLFPILVKVAQHVGEREDAYQNRYPGFLSERLITFYFERRRNEYKVVYADKNFLE